ncbi:Mcm21p [Saccharomyces cerevisiae YJM1385]|nr:Mcm21p [Saccharomyces cerevisiae YJM1385]
MSRIDDLQQDIESLLSEINSLEESREKLKAKIKDKRKNEESANPIVQEFEDLFDQFPQLNNFLFNEHPELEETDDKDISRAQADIPATPIPYEPKKRAKLENEEILPEQEWVLKTQPMVQHQMFDPGVADLLDTDILTSPSKRKRKLKIDDISTSDRSELEDYIVLENVYRMFGITFFPLVDPIDLKIKDASGEIFVDREMLGIRLEVFSERTSQFEKPHYVLLKKRIKSNSWFLFKHTIPSFIDVQGIFDDTNGGLVLSHDDAYLFAKRVFLQLVEVQKRRQIFKDLEAKKIIHDLDLDLESSMVSFFVKDIKVELFVKQNEIVSCSILDDIHDFSQNNKSKWEIALLGSLDDLELKLNHSFATIFK